MNPMGLLVLFICIPLVLGAALQSWNHGFSGSSVLGLVGLLGIIAAIARLRSDAGNRDA